MNPTPNNQQNQNQLNRGAEGTPGENTFNGKTPQQGGKANPGEQSNATGGWGLGDPGKLGGVSPPNYSAPVADAAQKVVEIKFPGNNGNADGDELKPIDEKPPVPVKDIVRSFEGEGSERPSEPGSAQPTQRIPNWVLEFKKRQSK